MKKQGDLYLIPPDDRFMVPFRLISGAPAYVSWKSLPQARDTHVIEWFRRLRVAREIYDPASKVEIRCLKLQEVASSEGVTHVVYPVRKGNLDCRFLQPLSELEGYALAKVTR